jgi:hypothetical protein
VFERYTEKARRVIFFGRYEASQFGSPYIEDEHLLLGLLRESKDICAKFFPVPFSVDDLRKEIEQHTSVEKKISTSVDLPLSNECRHILNYAAEEADRLGHKHIGTEHLFIGVLLEKDCYACQLLKKRGVILENARSIVGEPTAELPERFRPVKSPGIPTGHRWKNLLYNAPSETLILEMQRGDTGHLPISRLFARRKDSERYEPIGEPAEHVSFESAVTCAKHPIVIFNSMNWDSVGGRFEGAYSFDLLTKELTLCIAKDSLGNAQQDHNPWVLSLVSLSDDAQTLILKVGIKKLGSLSEIVVDYYLASLNLTDKRLELLSQLKDTRF